MVKKYSVAIVASAPHWSQGLNVGEVSVHLDTWFKIGGRAEVIWSWVAEGAVLPKGDEILEENLLS